MTWHGAEKRNENINNTREYYYVIILIAAVFKFMQSPLVRYIAVRYLIIIILYGLFCF